MHCLRCKSKKRRCKATEEFNNRDHEIVEAMARELGMEEKWEIPSDTKSRVLSGRKVPEVEESTKIPAERYGKLWQTQHTRNEEPAPVEGMTIVSRRRIKKTERALAAECSQSRERL